MKLSKSALRKQLKALKGWSLKGDAITKLFTLKDFPDAIAFVTRLAFDAQAADHHPDLQISYRKVTVTWSTHSEGGVTGKDLAGAKQTDAIAKNFA